MSKYHSVKRCDRPTVIISTNNSVICVDRNEFTFKETNKICSV